MSDSKGIQQLMEAEQTATKIVQDMREAKTERMKQAKTEAAEVVEKYRLEKEREFESMSTKGGLSVEMQDRKRQTDVDIAKMQKQFDANKGAVIDMILDHVTTVNLS